MLFPFYKCLQKHKHLFQWTHVNYDHIYLGSISICKTTWLASVFWENKYLGGKLDRMQWNNLHFFSGFLFEISFILQKCFWKARRSGPDITLRKIVYSKITKRTFSSILPPWKTVTTFKLNVFFKTCHFNKCEH